MQIRVSLLITCFFYFRFFSVFFFLILFYVTDGLIKNLERGTWIGDVCKHDNVSHIKLKDLEGCDHSSNTANLLFVQHVCSIKNSTNSEGMCRNAFLLYPLSFV